MKSNSIFIALIAVSILLSSCEKTIDIAIDEQNNLIVLNGILKAGEYPSIQLYQSKFIFDRGESQPVRDAIVTIFENGVALDPLVHQTAGLYSNEQIVIKPSHEYTIKVTHSRLQDVEATVEIPARLSKENVQVKNKVIEVAGYESNWFVSDISLLIEDRQETEDYYIISLIKMNKEYYKNGDEDTLASNFIDYALEIEDPLIEMIYINYNVYYGLRDNLFNGKSFRGEFSSYKDLSPNVSDDEYAYMEKVYKVRIDHLSEGLYQYYIRLEDNRYPEAFTEPTQVYSNIENGYGILGASSTLDVDIE